MKSLVAGILLIILVGFAGFLYRNVAERTAVPQACTMEARICPDGTSVGRVGPSCEFAPCPFPNVESEELRISFVAPEGYTAAGPLSFRKDATGGVSHTIEVTSFPIPEGMSAEDVILANTRYQPADMQAEDFKRFKPFLLNGREYRVTVIERFEAVVQSAYYFPRETDVLRFTVTEHDVTYWTDADLNVLDLPEHTALHKMLMTLELH